MRVQLFATGLGDLVFPSAIEDAERLLRAGGCEVEFPRRQVCCGQPAFNSGHHAAARRVARGFARAFARDLPVVVPSGSCATMLSHYLIWHGRRRCHAKKPACGACQVARWCPSYGTGPTDPALAEALVRTEGPN